MDSSGWNWSPVFTNISSSWSNQQHGIQQNFTQDIFNNPIQFNNNSNLNQNMVGQLAPAFDSVLTKLSVPGTSWSQALNAPELYGLVADFSTGTPSLESLDCLLSGTNSYTDTNSLEEDDISMNIFSDCNNLWNFGSNISSGDSRNSRAEIEEGKSGETAGVVKHQLPAAKFVRRTGFRGDCADERDDLQGGGIQAGEFGGGVGGETKEEECQNIKRSADGGGEAEEREDK